VETHERAREHRSESAPAFASTLTGLIVLAGVGVAGVYALDGGASLLLLGAPFLSGFATAFAQSAWFGGPQLRKSIVAALSALAVACLGLVAFVEDGLFLVLMALPPAIVLAGLGALMGHSIARHGRPSMSPVVALLMCWPLLAAAEPDHERPEPREVRSAIHVNRSPQQLATRALDQEMSAASPWYFIVGIAQPARELHLHALPGGGTRIEVRTWYMLDMYPDRYWSLWSDAILHRVQMRALAQIKQQAEVSPN
jgi:hypothetical protein